MNFLRFPVGRWGLPLLSGVFIGTSYIPFPPWASLFGFVPLWLFWSRQSNARSVFLGGLLASFVFTLIGFNWVTYLLHEFAGMNWPLAVVGMIGFGLAAHLFVPVAGLLWFWGDRRSLWSRRLSLPAMALMTTLCEHYSLTLFDWNFGYTWFGAGIPVYQWAEFVGFSGISAATLLCNLPLYYAWTRRRERSGKLTLATVVTVFALLNLGGIWLEQRLPAPDLSLRALLVQGNMGSAEPMEKIYGGGYREEMLRRYFRLTDQALEAAGGKVDFAMWPESAFPGLLGEAFRDQQFPTALREYLKERQLALVTGTYGADLTSRLLTNSLFVLGRDGEIIQPSYSKTILLAFGEYIPGEQWFPQIRDWLPATGHFARGPGPTVLLNLGQFRMGPQICYESLFPWFSHSLAQLGAQFIVNVTNDSWYGHWQEPYQHLYMTLARAVEFRRPVLRVTNTGISTVALASGEVLRLSPIGEAWAGLYEVPFLRDPAPTFYQRWFYLVPTLLWAGLAVLVIGGRTPRKWFGD